MESLYFGKDNDGTPEPYYHADSGDGCDYSLCGLGNIEDAITTNRRINCPVCIGIIERCKKLLKGRDYALSKKKSKK